MDAIPSGGFLQACEPGNSFKSSCSILQDLTTIYTDKTKGAAVWVDDYSFLAVVTLVFVVIESYRYKRAIIPWVLATLLLGPDCVLPIFLTGHMHRGTVLLPSNRQVVTQSHNTTVVLQNRRLRLLTQRHASQHPTMPWPSWASCPGTPTSFPGWALLGPLPGS